MEEPIEESSKLLCFIRHGERTDKTEDLDERERIVNKWDPPLTKIGVSMAHLCGRSLRLKLEKLGYEKVIIEVSPFLRCMETAAAIAKELNIDEVSVNYKWGEWLDLKYYPVCSPIPSLTINNTD